jgi:multiple RNA-binding domain-containing protein 1
LQVLAATKADLKDCGVNVGALEAAAAASGSAANEGPVARSKTTLIIKNLPYACTEDELHDLFQKFGGAQCVVLPSTRALALVELGDVQARN